MSVFNFSTLEYEGSDAPDGHESAASSSPSCLRLSHHRRPTKRYITRSTAKPRGTIQDLNFTQPASEFDPGVSRLMNLPPEVFEKILRFVEENSKSEARHIHKRRFAHLSKLTAGATYFYSCVHIEEPILNSLEALSVTNQCMYALCRPLLWKVGTHQLKYHVSNSSWLMRKIIFDLCW